MLDAFILNCFTPWSDPTAGVLTREYYRSRFLRWALYNFDVHPTRKRMAEPNLIRAIRRMVENGRKIVIYPEGGSRWCGTPMDWIESTAKIFARSGVPVYPILMHGSYVSWPRWANYPRRGKIEIEVRDPINLTRSTPPDEALSAYQAPVNFDECQTPERLKPKRAFKPASGIHRLLYRDPDTGQQDAIISPDGVHVQNKSGSINLQMLPDSSLIDVKSGETFLTSELYLQISAIPLQRDTRGCHLKNHVEFSSETDFPNLNKHGRADACLYDDRIEIETQSDKRVIELEHVIGVDVERNLKLQIFSRNEMFQLSFVEDGSALGWKDAIQRIILAAQSHNVPSID